jgi:hypothetical protein
MEEMHAILLYNWCRVYPPHLGFGVVLRTTLLFAVVRYVQKHADEVVDDFISCCKVSLLDLRTRIAISTRFDGFFGVSSREKGQW